MPTETLFGDDPSVMIDVSWDQEAERWFIQETNVPGLSLCAATLDEMESKIQDVVPKILAAEGLTTAQGERMDETHPQIIEMTQVAIRF